MTAFVAIDEVVSATSAYFSRHWNASAIGQSPPEWQGWYEFNGSAPNYQLGGCYALFEGDELHYIGLGASLGGGRYIGHGLSRRLKAHVLQNDWEKGPEWLKLRPRWPGISSIYTIGFDNENVHLAPSLETFLIRKFAGRIKNQRVISLEKIYLYGARITYNFDESSPAIYGEGREPFCLDPLNITPDIYQAIRAWAGGGNEGNDLSATLIVHADGTIERWVEEWSPRPREPR